MVPGPVAPPTTKVGKRPRDPVVPIVGHDEAETTTGDVDDLIEAFSKVMRTARPGERPAAWLRAAQSAGGGELLIPLRRMQRQHQHCGDYLWSQRYASR